ncbi:hypothetical protein [Saccharothrix sp. HUAS TT1]|uniref:hypothetical protein n=1 Tax=unclassified Saccharothrix TaxID=2593673 RepID=UPI00345B5B6E
MASTGSTTTRSTLIRSTPTRPAPVPSPTGAGAVARLAAPPAPLPRYDGPERRAAPPPRRSGGCTAAFVRDPVERGRRELRACLEDLLAVNAVQLPYRALCALRELWTACDEVLHRPLPDGDEAREFADTVRLVQARVERRIRPWAEVTALPADESTRVELGASVLGLCMDLQSLADLMHPDLRVRNVTISWFAPSAGRTVTFAGAYLPDAEPPCCLPPAAQAG